MLSSGEPQRINGGFEGVINGEELKRTELHTYVMTAEGRSYTALSQIPPHLGRSLLLLNAIGGAMGWLFAKVCYLITDNCCYECIIVSNLQMEIICGTLAEKL